MGEVGRARMEGLLVVGPDGESTFNRLKKPAQRATWSRFREQVKWLDQVDALGDTDAWLDGIAPSEIADFAGEADAQDADTLSRYEAVKQVALLACLTHTVRMRARDDLVGAVAATLSCCWIDDDRRPGKFFKEVGEAVSDRGGGVRSRGEAARKRAAPWQRNRDHEADDRDSGHHRWSDAGKRRCVG
ncbi:MAG TPA: hypothetical protein VM347_22595 [Nonomuraea sp.]|nr:hypothetical protein [Nonomuraea sp.]